MPRGRLPLVCLAGLSLVIMACSVGPPYQRPVVQTPPAYKETPPASFKALDGWKEAQPSDDLPRGPWWEIFQDPRLNALIEQVNVSNQNIAAAEARFRGARAAIGVAQASQFPTITASATITGSRPSLNRAAAGRDPSSATRSNYQFPLDVSYELDLWGRIRRNIELNLANAQASAADLETVRLSTHAELATNYFALHGLDAQKQLLDLTIAAFERALELTTNRYNQGVASQIEVLQARTQLETTRAQAIAVGVQRAQFEHAIAILLGKPPAEFTLPAAPLTVEPPAIPAGLPSELLVSRPDIISAEHQLRAGDANIGAARAAFLPRIALTGSFGTASSDLNGLFDSGSRAWTFMPTLSMPIFDGGRRRANLELSEVRRDIAVAGYEKTIQTAFREVADALSAKYWLAEQLTIQGANLETQSERARLAQLRYDNGSAAFLEVLDAQRDLLGAQQQLVQARRALLSSQVALYAALGGGTLAASNEVDGATSTPASIPSTR